MTEKEKEAIEYLKVRLYGNEGCKSIDVSQKDLRIFLKLIDRKEKEIESWKKYSNEQEESIAEKNNKIYDLEFKIQTQQEEIEKKDKVIDLILEKQAGSSCLNIYCKKRNKKDKCLECVKEYFINKVEKEN